MSKEIENMNSWRLPTLEELETLYNESSKTRQEMENCFYWSSITDKYNPSYAWFMDFNYGDMGYGGKLTCDNYVRFVKDTKNGLEWSKTIDKRMSWCEANNLLKEMV